MNIAHRLSLGGTLVFALAVGGPASADTFIENFEAGPAHVGNWSYGIAPTYPATGGNPGKYQRTTNIDTFAPQPRTLSATSIFTGNYRDAFVTSVGVDLNTFAVGLLGGRPSAFGHPGEQQRHAHQCQR